jgi:mRNA interferase HigB
MHVIAKRRLREFANQFPDAAQSLNAWYTVMRRARYGNAHELKQQFGSASVLGDYRTVFNIGGNNYRLVVDMRYDLGRVYVREFLTHAEYTRRSRAQTL